VTQGEAAQLRARMIDDVDPRRSHSVDRRRGSPLSQVACVNSLLFTYSPRCHTLPPRGPAAAGDATTPLSTTLCYGTAVLSLCTLVYCGQMVGWIKMPLGTDVGLGPGDIVLAQLPHGKGAQEPPTFRPMCGQTLAHLSNCSALV